ncbi:hypothetical protein GCM10020221_10950 [Streptomyces thioluteus]|uniref:Uncharacterized protein n=1 Tax=Streptomyces thioluteus TaxID=66431 RepID=A0ABN3WJP2_STRTU
MLDFRDRNPDRNIEHTRPLERIHEQKVAFVAAHGRVLLDAGVVDMTKFCPVGEPLRIDGLRHSYLPRVSFEQLNVWRKHSC